jgi:hypothetical protein
MISNPKLQKQLDAEFLPVDDWSFTAIAVSGLLKNKPFAGRDKAVRLLREYMDRNEAIHQSTNNQNYREASRFVAVLTKNIMPLSASLDKIASRFDIENTKHHAHREVMFAEITASVVHEGIIRR